MKIRVNETSASPAVMTLEAETAAEGYQLRALFARLHAVNVCAGIVDRETPSISIILVNRSEE